MYVVECADVCGGMHICCGMLFFAESTYSMYVAECTDVSSGIHLCTVLYVAECAFVSQYVVKVRIYTMYVAECTVCARKQEHSFIFDVNTTTHTYCTGYFVPETIMIIILSYYNLTY